MENVVHLAILDAANCHSSSNMQEQNADLVVYEGSMYSTER